MPFPVTLKRKTIWGFDLSEARWSAFKGKNMYDRQWPHFRRERIVAYQVAQNICIGATIPATFSESKYNHLQTHVQQYALSSMGLSVELHNNDIIAGEILTLVFCSFIGVIFGLEFIMLVLWPRRTTYPRWYNYTRMIGTVVMTGGLLAAALVSTVVVAKHSAFITGASEEQQDQLIDVFFRPPLKYNDFPANVAYVCFLWIGWVCAVVATTLLIIGVRSEMKSSKTGTREIQIPPPIELLSDEEKGVNEV